MAQQCFINEYVFWYTDDERDKVCRLRDLLIVALQSRSCVPELWIAAVAAYFPLHSLPAHTITGSPWSDAVAEIIAQQLVEPQREDAYRAKIPCLSEDSVSISVQRQYEENPYPRWVNTATMVERATVGQFLRELFPHAALSRLDKEKNIEILVAGCGTGQQAIEAAMRFPYVQVLAIDLSLASLCYASRKKHEAGLDNIRYAQADILQMGAIGMTFDLIEATGVLHHLADPLVGWRVLLSLLRPGGYMRVGLYSALL